MPFLRLHLGILGHDLLHIVRKIGELLHLPNLDHFVVRGRAALRPFDRLVFRLDLDHPVAAQDLLHPGKGLGVTFGFPTENETRAPIEGGCRPSSPSNTPAFCRASLYFIIAATALASGICPAAAVSYPFGIISIMNRITVSWLLFGDRLKGGKAGLEVLADHAVHAEKNADQLRDEAGGAVHGPGNVRGVAFAVQSELGDVVAFKRRNEI